MGDTNNTNPTDPNAPVTMPGSQGTPTPAPTGGDLGNTGSTWQTPGAPVATPEPGVSTPDVTPEPGATMPAMPGAPVNEAPAQGGSTWPQQPTPTDGQNPTGGTGTGTTGI